MDDPPKGPQAVNPVLGQYGLWVGAREPKWIAIWRYLLLLISFLENRFRGGNYGGIEPLGGRPVCRSTITMNHAIIYLIFPIFPGRLSPAVGQWWGAVVAQRGPDGGS